MKKLFVLLLVALCSACAKDHSVPPANLVYLSVVREEDFDVYDIRYTSDVDALNLFGKGDREGIASAQLQCALGEDQDFSVGHFQRNSAYGLLERDQLNKDALRYSYVTSAFLRKTKSNGSSEGDLSVAELHVLLSNRTSVPCKVIITAYGYNAYYSNTLHIPTTDLLREINKPKSN
jgi:hypothetical protein